jgi:dienelactone hydrolase
VKVPRFPGWLAAICAIIPYIPAPGVAAPLETYGGLPTLSTVRISPDGRLLAMTTLHADQRRVVIQRTDTRQTVMERNFGALKLRDVQWAGGDHLIVTTSQTSGLLGVTARRREWFQAVDIDWRQKTLRPLLTGVPSALNVIYGRPEIRLLDGRPVAFVQGTLMVRGRGRLTLFRTDLESGVTSIAARGFADTADFVVDANGAAIAQARYDANKSRWSLDLWKGRWEEAVHLNAPIGTPRVLGLGRDGASIAVAYGGDNEAVVRELDPDGHGVGEPFSAPDPEQVIWDPMTGRLIGDGALVGETQRYIFFDPADQAAWNGALAAFPGARLELSSLTEDHRKFVIRVDAPAHEQAYFLFDADKGKASLIGASYEGLTAADVSPLRAISFKAGDGVPLTGYVTLPRDRPAKALPAVVLVHGGPAARDEPGFDWWSQALASRGYAVVRVNYRGSAGMGSALLSAGFGQWGRRMQTDLSDGVHMLASQGVIDPARVCIVGGSYGGYAALAGATIDSGVYRCAASVAGPSDLRRLVDWSKAERGDQGAGVERYWLRYMGSKSDLAAISPARLADKATIPILLIHGRDDTVVPYEQSQLMADALARAGKAVEFVTLDQEDHWLSRPETRLRMLRAMVDFLERNNPAGGRG